MYDFDSGTDKYYALALAMAAYGAAVGFLSFWVATVAAQLGEDKPLLPSLIRAAPLRGTGNQALTPIMVTGFVAVCLYALGITQIVPLMVFIGLAAPICALDLKVQAIPEELTWGLLFSGALMSTWHTGAEDAVIGAAVAAVAVWFSMASVEYATGRNTRSGGDIAAAAAGGAWVGLYLTGVYVMAVCVLFTLFCALDKRKGGDGWVPMGPALMAAVPLCVMVRPVVDRLSWWLISAMSL